MRKKCITEEISGCANFATFTLPEEISRCAARGLKAYTNMKNFLWGFIKDRVYVPPLPNDLPELRHRMEEAIVYITPDLLTGSGRIRL